MSGLRQARSGLAIMIPLALLFLLLGYEARTEYRAGVGVTRAARPVGEDNDGPGGEPVRPEITEVMVAGTGTATPGRATTTIRVTGPVAAAPQVSPAALPTGRAAITVTVEAGQTLAGIADRFATTVETIQQLNGIIDPNYLPAGQELLVPGGYRAGELETWPAVPAVFSQRTIGTSANGNAIESFTIGAGDNEVVVIGGIHGGYEWNSVLLAYRFLAYFGSHPEAVPEDVRLHIIPAGNPDGVVAVTGQAGPFAAASVSGDTTVGRLNGNGVDLNRNWGCDWSAEGQWRDVVVSGGGAPFSEPETRALRDYLSQDGIAVVIWLHSAAGLVVPAGCEEVSHRPSEAAAALYGEAAGYPVGAFTAYPVSGDAGDWLAQQGIASFTVELSDHENVELDRNLNGLLSLLEGIAGLGE